MKNQKSINISILNVNDIDEFLAVIEKYKLDTQEKRKFDIKIHFDVMDNVFVKNVGVNLEFIKIVKMYGFFVDVHLMVQDPLNDNYIDKALEYGADAITIHYEIPKFEESLNYLLRKKYELQKRNSKLTVGVSVKTETSLNVLDNYIDYIDLVLIMSVEPGKGGQKYMNTTDIKLKNISSKLKNKIIEIDGGINESNLNKIIKFKVDWLVIGSYLTSSEDYKSLYHKLDLINMEVAK